MPGAQGEAKKAIAGRGRPAAAAPASPSPRRAAGPDGTFTCQLDQPLRPPCKSPHSSRASGWRKNPQGILSQRKKAKKAVPPGGGTLGTSESKRRHATRAPHLPDNPCTEAPQLSGDQSSGSLKHPERLRTRKKNPSVSGCERAAPAKASHHEDSRERPRSRRLHQGSGDWLGGRAEGKESAHWLRRL